MEVGMNVAGRFMLLERIGQGGMGQVFRAEDLTTGRVVALKAMTSIAPGLVERFVLEAKTLASLSHPAIVGYVAHGTSEHGRPFLAMDWLAGTDLAHVLSRGPLGPAGTLTVLRRVAEALDVAHQHGIVHRDLKPANIMLVGDQPQGATVVDFGIAKAQGITRGLTRTGAIVGTVGYMAPEQLQGAQVIDGRADLFSLGCVAFECLTGRPAFGGDNLGAVVGRIVLGECPRVRETAPSLPPALDELIAKLMRPQREERFASAREVLLALDGIGDMDHYAPTELAPTAARFTLRTERSPVAIVLASPPETGDAPSSSAPSDGAHAAHACEAIAKRWGGQLTALVDRSFLLTFSQSAALQDQVVRAARAALDVHASVSGWNVSLALSLTETEGGLHRKEGLASGAEGTRTAASGVVTGIELDANTRAFLGSEFVVEETGGRVVLTSFIASQDEPRKVLGRSAPCMGRDKELRLIESTLDECADESTHRALILRAPPGVGKSRIRREFVARMAARDDVRMLVARCDVGTQSTALGVVRAWIREALDLGRGGADERWEILRTAALPLLKGCPSVAAERLLEFFAELADVSIPEPSAALLDARSNAREMRQMLQLALETWLRAASGPGPVVLVLEDLHWADPSSVSLLASAWNALAGAPLLLLVTTWPEGESAHPSIVSLKNTQVVDVAPLGKRTAERIARKLLGDETPSETVARVVELAEGNAFLLEEITRHVGAGHSLESFPGSVIAVVQARLTALPPDARRLMRVASVLGERFHPDALLAMRGADSDATSPITVLERLRRDELVLSPTDEHDAAGVWAFRHSLVRQAAYEMLSDEDRAAAHRAAAEWLATRSDGDPATIGEHLEKAGSLREALPWFLKAMEQHEVLGDYEAISTLAHRIDRDELDPRVRADVVYHATYSDLYLGRYEVLATLDERLQRGEFPRGSPGWAALTSTMVAMKVHAGMPVDVQAEIGAIREANASLDASIASVFTLCLLSVSLAHLGMLDEARHTAEMLRAITSSPDTPAGWSALRDAYIPWLMAVDDDPDALAQHRTGVELALRACSLPRQQEIIPPFVAFLVEFGADGEARGYLERHKQNLSHGELAASDFWLLGESALAAFGSKPTDCRALLERQRNPEWKHLDPWIRANCQASPSLANPADRALALEAIAKLEAIAAECGPLLTMRNNALVLLAQCALNAGDPERALAATEPIVGGPDVLLPGMRTRMQLSRLRALAALGRTDEAARGIELARARISHFASGLAPGDRASFLAMPAVAATLGFQG